MTESKSNLVAADVSPQDAMPHQRARKFRELCALPPSPGGEGEGEGERFLQSHFRRKRLITQNPKSEINESLLTLAATVQKFKPSNPKVAVFPGKPACSYFLSSNPYVL